MRTVKVFLCVAMSDRSNEEILNDLDVMRVTIAEAVNAAGHEVELEFVDNFDCVRPEGNTQKAYFIGEAIKKLGDCDVLFYMPKARKQPGCQTEIDYCRNYGIPTLALHENPFTGEWSAYVG